MRIDDENKVVYLDEPLFDELTKLKKRIGHANIVSLFQILWEYKKEWPEIKKLLWSYENDIWTNDREPLPETDEYNQILMVKIWSGEYEFKLEQPQKYYWRKKKEHLAWFENIVATYLHENSEGNLHLDCLMFALKATETEARDLLKHDFDKFEKVECE